MMLGTPYTGRLPTTQANLNLLKARISKIKNDMKLLDRMIAQGRIDSREAGYRRQQYTGEIYDLERTISSSRLSTPSYRVPRDLQAFRAKKPAKKLISDSTPNKLPEGYFGTDTGGNHSSITSDWEPTAPTFIDVPDLPVQTGSSVAWPSHWPGSHSILITNAVMDAGQVNGKRILDPRKAGFPMKSSLKTQSGLNEIITIRAKYLNLQDTVSFNPSFTPSDSTLVKLILSSIDTTMSAAGASTPFDPTTPTQFDTNGFFTDAAFERVVDDIIRIDNRIVMMYNPASGWAYTTAATAANLPLAKKGFQNLVAGNSTRKYLRQDQLKAVSLAIQYLSSVSVNTVDPYRGQEDTNSGDPTVLPPQEMIIEHEGGGREKVIDTTIAMPPESLRGELLYNGVPSMRVSIQRRAKGGMRYFKFNFNDIGSGKLIFTWQSPNDLPMDVNYPPMHVLEMANLAYRQEILEGASDPLNGYKRSSRNARRNGSLMGLGAMQSYDRRRSMRDNKELDKSTYNQTLRELSMARARSGSSVDLTKQLKEEPVTRPWTLQVSLPPEKTQELRTMIDYALTRSNLSQDMFTQQAHNYVASIVNSLSSDMSPTQQTEYVVERIMSEMVNRSALLKKDIKVDIDASNNGIRFETQEEQNIEGLGSALLKTKAAMGRLLG